MAGPNRPLRVLMTADCVGGVWTYATTLCRALAPHGVHVTLAITGGEMSDSQRQEADGLENVDWHHRPYKCEWMQPPLADVEAASRWLDELVASSRPDVVHLNDYAHGGREFAGLPRVVVAHSDVVSWHHHARGERTGAAWDEYERTVASGLRSTDAIVAPTRAVMEDVRRHYLSDAAAEAADSISRSSEIRSFRCGVIANAVQASVVDVATVREPFILCAGRVWDEAKNVRTLAEAARGLPWPVKVAGDATHPDGGTASVENVELLGSLPHAELIQLMSRAAIYALPAKYEPFGLSAVEAALCGCALVLGDIASLREVWGDTAIFVPPGDAAALHTALLEMIGNEHKKIAATEAARRRAQTYTPERQARSYVDLYRRIVENARP